MATNDTIELSVRGVVHGQVHVHTLHFRMVQPALIEGDLLTDYETNCASAYRALFPTTSTPWQTLQARQVCGTVPLRAPAISTPGTTTGTHSPVGQGLPPWLAAVVSERTTLQGRSRRGRFFIGGLHEGDLNGDGWESGVGLVPTRVGAYITALGRYMAGGAQQANFRLVVHSPTLAAVPGTQCDASSTFVSTLVLRPTVGTMKSRRAGSGT